MKLTEDTVSVVIGGTSGIGYSVAEKLRERNGTVVVASRRTGLDMTNEERVRKYFDSLGELDHLVITAGSNAPAGEVASIDIRDAQQGFDTKFWGSIIVVKEAAKHIREGGSITLTSGFLSRKTTKGAFVKSAMNAALEATTKILAKELAPIRVNVVSPGITDTEAYIGMASRNKKEMFERNASTLPTGRIGKPNDVADGYLFAIDNLFMTGAVIDLEGGALIN